jgi:hypothetical protein
MLEGAVVEIKAVYVDAHLGFVHSRRFLPGRLMGLTPPVKKMPGTLPGGGKHQ